MSQILYEISSPQNQHYKAWVSLLGAKGIKKHQQALLSGRSFTHEVLERYAQNVEGIILAEGHDATKISVPQNCPLYILPQNLFDPLDIYGIKGSILIVSAKPLPVWDKTMPKGVSVFLPLQNPINLGTTIRSAAAFGASVVLLQESATPYLPKCIRAAGPAIFQTPIFQGPSLEELSKLTHLPLYGMSPKGISMFNCKLPETVGLVAGLEGPGLDSYWDFNRRLSIPIDAQVESLNASVAMSIALALCRQGLQ